MGEATGKLLQIEDLSKNFGGVQAVDHCTFEIESGKITGLIGPNGAGKTTTFNMIAGELKPSSGRIIYNGDDITGLPTHEMFHRGIVRTFQIAHEFSSLSVVENLMMVPPNQAGEQIWNTWFHRSKIREEEERIRAKAEEVIGFLNLTHVIDEKAGNLSGGQKKLLELGRTMMVDAKLVLLDEVGAGVNRTLLAELGDAIIELNKTRGYTFCMIEHDMDFIGRLCDTVVVMAEGTVLAQGSAEEVRNNEDVIEAYLGRGLKNDPNAANEALGGVPENGATA